MTDCAYAAPAAVNESDDGVTTTAPTVGVGVGVAVGIGAVVGLVDGAVVGLVDGVALGVDVAVGDGDGLGDVPEGVGAGSPAVVGVDELPPPAHAASHTIAMLASDRTTETIRKFGLFVEAGQHAATCGNTS